MNMLPAQLDRPASAIRPPLLPGLLLCLILSMPCVMAQQRPCVTVNCPRAAQAEATSSAGAAVSFDVTASGTCEPIISLTCTPPSGFTFPIGTNTVRCVAVDLKGNRAECSFPVIVRDTTPPNISVKAPSVLPCATKLGAVLNYTASATDISLPVTLTCAPTNGAVLPIGTNTVTCIAADSHGNRSTNRFSVVVTSDCADCVDLVCPTEFIVAEPDASGSAVVKYDVQAANRCGGPVWVKLSPESGSVFPIGIHKVVGTAGVGTAILRRCEFTVLVKDTQPPIITIHAPPVVQCASQAGAPFNYVAEAADASPPVTMTCDPPSGTILPIGTHTITCIAKDAAGNQSTHVFPVLVTDECPDCIELSCPKTPIVADAGPRGTAIVDFTVGVTNRCGGTAWLKYSQEPGTAFPVGTTEVLCTAGTGLQVLRECRVTVVVRDVTPPLLQTSPGIHVVCTGFGQGGPGAVVKYGGIRVHDNADPAPKLEFTPPSGTFFHLGTHDVVCTATDASGNQSAIHFPVVVKSGPDCEVSADPDNLKLPDNWDFELGLLGWTPGGTAFSLQPTLGDNVAVRRIDEIRDQMETRIGGDYWRDLGYPIGHHGDYWIGTAELHADDSTAPGTMRDEGATGTLVSKPFQLTQRFVWMLIGGQQDHDRLRVELLVPVDGEEPGGVKIGTQWYQAAKHLTGHNDERLRRDFFDAADFIGKTCRIRIVDTSTTGHINVDDFRFMPHLPVATEVNTAGINHPAVVFRNGHTYDWDAPVWGLADLHTHPIAHLGLGQKVFHGQPDGSVSDALGNCNCSHGGHGLDNGCGNYLRQLVLAAFDGESPANPHQLGWDSNQWARFRKWPVFTSYSHQQMWFEWIRRAYDGGLRVMVALTVNNPLLAGATVDSVKPYDDVSVLEAQVKELKAFVARHSDFMEIAYDPFQLRQIVHDNKLAIIIGSETDDIGNFDGNPVIDLAGSAIARELVRKQIEHLYYDLGLRYIFPVHVTDNKFGGSAVYNALFTMATKKFMGAPTLVEPAGNGIVYRVPSLDATKYLPDAGAIIGAMAEALFNPFAPLKLILETQSMITGQNTSFSDSSVGLAALATVATLPLIASSPASVAAAPALFEFLGDFGSLDLPSDILPIGGNYPDYSSITNKDLKGHRNVRGLSPLGEFAVGEMMRLGMIVDVDHMSEKAVEGALDLAEQVPGFYPMNSGHNSFRALRHDASENSRTPGHLQRIEATGGLMGLGWGNGDFRSVSAGLSGAPSNSISYVENDNAGSSKTFAQSMFYAREFIHPRRVALGSDINGFVVGPGPRFGPQSAFGMREEKDVLPYRSMHIKAQKNGIAYSPREGRPGASGVFQGRAVDPDKNDENARTIKGYAYNQQQRDFWVALRIFRWGYDRSPRLTHDDVPLITDNLHDTYDRNRIKEFVRGLLIGPTNGDAGKDIDGDVETKQKLAKAVYRKRVLNETPPSEITGDETKNRRYHHFLDVWDDYAKIYGDNIPMKRSETSLVQWDYNFDGLAHYGLLPDFFQDLRNVDAQPADMTGMFQSAEGFAQMWLHCLSAAWTINHPLLNVRLDLLNSNGGQPGRNLIIDWKGRDSDVIEESDDPGNPRSWRPSSTVRKIDRQHQTVTLETVPGLRARFFRVRKSD